MTTVLHEEDEAEEEEEEEEEEEGEAFLSVIVQRGNRKNVSLNPIIKPAQNSFCARDIISVCRSFPMV